MDDSKQKELVIIGGGVVGLTAAYEASKKGWHVTLIEKEKDVAQATSKEHTGVLSLYASANLNPSNLDSMIEHGGYRDHMSPPADILQNWHRTGGRESPLSNLKQRAVLAKNSEAIRSSDSDHPAYVAAGYHFSDTGLVRLYPDGYNMDKDLAMLRELTIAHNCEGNRLTMPGGSMDSAAFCHAMRRSLEEEGKLTVLTNCEATKFTLNHTTKKITGLTTSGGTITGDSYMLCTGAAKQLLADVNPAIAAKIMPFAGVSKTVQLPKAELDGLTFPTQLVYPNASGGTDMVNVAAFATDDPDKLAVRFAGFYCAGNMGKNGAEHFECKLDKAIADTLGDVRAKGYGVSPLWNGRRPMTANGLPIIGKDPNIENLVYNIGHGSSGTSLAAGSAEIAIDALEPKRTKTALEIALAPGGASIVR